MPIKIIKKDEFVPVENIVMVIYGQAGVGKTSLGFSASNPLLLAFDDGIHRAVGRKDCVQINTWHDIIDLDAEILEPYDTIVIDTAGKLLQCLANFIIAQNPKLGKSNGELQIAGYGALGNSFKMWISKIKSYKKDIVLICHSKEEKKGETLFTRFDAIGSSKDEIIIISDIIGYYYMEGRKRVIDFNPTEEHLGKNCANIDPQMVPSLIERPDYLSNLIDEIKSHMNKKNKEQQEAEEKFNMMVELIKSANDASSCTELTTKDFISKSVALKKILLNHATSLGFVFNKETKSFEESSDVATA